jgi:hypothetical protein
MPIDQQRKDALVKRVMTAKNAATFVRSDRIFEFTGPQMEELSLSLSALVLAFLSEDNAVQFSDRS